MDTRTSTGLVKLPSKVKKVFSIFSIASLGAVALSENKKFKNNSAGYQSRFGHKCLSRGVAKNPVDHPHGGRAKAIRYQRLTTDELQVDGSVLKLLKFFSLLGESNDNFNIVTP